MIGKSVVKVMVNKFPYSVRFGIHAVRRGVNYWQGRKQKYGVMIETSNICNAHCVFCSNPKLKREKKVMSETVFTTIYNRLLQEKIDVRTFTLHLNGEPLTDPNIFERIKILKNKWPKATIGFTSNFALADKVKIQQILDCGMDYITVSLNSLEAEEYYRNMGIPFARTYKNLVDYLEENKRRGNKVKTTVSLVLRPDNVPMYEQFKEKFKGVADIRAIRFGKWIEHEDLLGESATALKAKGEMNAICNQLYRTITFLSNGDYALCCFDAEGSVHKNVMDTSISEAMESEIFKKTCCYQLFYGRTNSECRGCSFVY